MEYCCCCTIYKLIGCFGIIFPFQRTNLSQLSSVSCARTYNLTIRNHTNVYYTKQIYELTWYGGSLYGSGMSGMISNWGWNKIGDNNYYNNSLWSLVRVFLGCLSKITFPHSGPNELWIEWHQSYESHWRLRFKKCACVLSKWKHPTKKNEEEERQQTNQQTNVIINNAKVATEQQKLTKYNKRNCE